MLFCYNVMFADLCILSFNGFSKLISTSYFFKRIIRIDSGNAKCIFKSPGMRNLPGFQINLFAFTITNTLPNKFLGSMNSKMKRIFNYLYLTSCHFVTGRPCYTGYKALARSIR